MKARISCATRPSTRWGRIWPVGATIRLEAFLLSRKLWRKSRTRNFETTLDWGRRLRIAPGPSWRNKRKWMTSSSHQSKRSSLTAAEASKAWLTSQSPSSCREAKAFTNWFSRRLTCLRVYSTEENTVARAHWGIVCMSTVMDPELPKETFLQMICKPSNPSQS